MMVRTQIIVSPVLLNPVLAGKGFDGREPKGEEEVLEKDSSSEESLGSQRHWEVVVKESSKGQEMDTGRKQEAAGC